MCALKVPLLRSSIYFYLCVPRVAFRALPSFHPGLCRSVVPTALRISLDFDTLALDTFRASASKHLNYTKRKQSLRFLFSKPQRSLYRLQLKFVQTTAEVCTDYSWSLQKVLRTYKFKYAYLLKQVRALTKVFVRTYGFEEPSTLGAKTLGGRKVLSLC